MKLIFSQNIQQMLFSKTQTKGEVNKEGSQELTQDENQQEGC